MIRGIALLLCPFVAAAQSGPVVISYDAASAPLRLAAAEVRAACTGRGMQVSESPTDEAAKSSASLRIVLRAGKAAGPQSYSIRRRSREYLVTGADAVGAMYGGLDLAEAIRVGAPIENADKSPHILQRGIKFNIPLDARTPSYSDNSDSAQQNIPEMWSFDFWREFLDDMARHRYNVLSLWNLHPFPSIVKVPEYPDVALNDVMRTTVQLDDTFSHSGSDMVRPAMLRDLETVRKITIGEKINFWRDVMQYAKDRGIDVYLFTWNMFVFGAEGKHGITKSQTDLTTIDYFRKSVRETVLTYPLLAGMGITAGERLENRTDEFSREKWLWKTYGEGIRDALRIQPSRQFRMIHRYHMTAQSDIMNEWKDYPGPFDLSFKYAIAHMYASTKPPFINAALPHLSPKLRTWLTVRNDDIYSFRWGDAEFAREFIRNIPGPDKVAGFYMGPDGYNWGREFLSTEPETPRELVMKKQWYSFLLWGRLSYDPALEDARLESIVAHRFPQVDAKRLMAVQAQASRIFPEITKFSWGDIDLRWFPEACISHRKFRGFYTVRDFIKGVTMPGTGNLDVMTWRKRFLAKEPMNGKTPVEVAVALKSYAERTLSALPELRKLEGNNKELHLMLGDFQAMAHLGDYYAEKILAATELALFDATGVMPQRMAAVRHLEAAAEHWRRYADVYSRQYKPQLLNRVGYVDIPALIVKVNQDIDTAKSWTPRTIEEASGNAYRPDTPFRK
jgi:hypothetical protein